MDDLKKVIEYAQQDADRLGRPLVVLNLNRVGRPLYVCREATEAHLTSSARVELVTPKA